MPRISLALVLLFGLTALAQDLTDLTTYSMVLLKAGPNRSQPDADTAKLQEAHLAGIRKMFADGKLVVAGRFADKGELAGVFILRLGSIEEAKARADQEPI